MPAGETCRDFKGHQLLTKLARCELTTASLLGAQHTSSREPPLAHWNFHVNFLATQYTVSVDQSGLPVLFYNGASHTVVTALPE